MLNLPIRHHLHDLQLIRHTLQRPPNLPIALPKPKLGVLQPLLLAELLNQIRRVEEVVPRETREEVVRDLEVQSAVQEGERGVADDVGCGAELAVHEGFGGAEVGG